MVEGGGSARPRLTSSFSERVSSGFLGLCRALGFEAPEEFGGLGISDFRFNAILDEEAEYAGAVSDNFLLQNDIVMPYPPNSCRTF